MNGAGWSFSEDLSSVGMVVVAAVSFIAVALLAWELRYRERLGLAVTITGVGSVVALALAVLRPVLIESRGSLVGPKVLVLVDQSRRMELPSDGERSRHAVALEALAQLQRHFEEARLEVFGFGDDEIEPLANDEGTRVLRATDSDLVAALRRAREQSTEQPRAVVVISDGRLTRPGEDATNDSLRAALGEGEVPVHTVSVAERTRPDAAVRKVQTAGAAVAHQPLALNVELACVGGLDCGSMPVRVRELRKDSAPAVLASGRADFTGDTAVIQLRITLERAGARVVQVAIDGPPGDEIPENNQRFLAFDVARDRVRLLHVAGRPTYDVRALRMWLKSDESVDLIAFFILRTRTDETLAPDTELALIPFPVDELFTKHLPSFDAVVIQDIDAVEYKLANYLDGLATYVESGGGLIMVGGESSFLGGQYAGTALERVLPVELPERSEKFFDLADFVPRFTPAGRAAPILRGLHDLFGDDLPQLPGANILGAPRPGSIVLWEHPELTVGGGAMPILAIGEAGDGRAVALGVDGTHRLAFSERAADVGGRSYGAMWDGLLGWLMRDPRYEPARVSLQRPCVAGQPVMLEVVRIPGMDGDIEIVLQRLGSTVGEPKAFSIQHPPPGVVEVAIGELDAGGYVARTRVGAAPPTRFDFACEKGGEAWSDSRPDQERLAGIARAGQGQFVTAGRVDELPLPRATRVAAERHVSPMLPPWAWSLMASLLLGAHWLARRRGGLI
jgi:uncharacterized membrane protein